jgi:HEXXH motif-containing protein
VIQPYHLADDLYADMTLGPSSTATVDLLRSSQLTKHKLLIVYLNSVATAWPDAAGAFATLAEAERLAPDLVGELLSSPFVGNWAAWCVRVTRGTGDPGVDARTEIGAVGGLAAVAAAAAGLRTELAVPVRRGRVVLPTLGALHAVAGTGEIRISVADHGVTCHTDAGPVRPEHDHPAWSGIRRLGGGPVMLDDVDPFRDCYRKPVADRLDAAEFDRWDRCYREAMDLIGAHAPGRLAELTSGLRSLVPLSTAHAEPGLSATSRAAFGALGLTLPPRPEYLAATLVHEYQHSKLSALIDLVPLYDPTATELYFAPWRLDPRPIGGLLQGAYAFVAVSDLWFRLMSAPAVAAEAGRQFALLRLQVRESVQTLESAPHLTFEGHRIVAGIRRLLDTLLAVELPADVDAEARRALRATTDGWLVRNT